MKKYISILSMAGILCAGILTVYAKTDVTEGDWDDDDTPGNVTVEFVKKPVAAYAGLHLTLSTTDSNAQIYWTTDAEIAPESETGWVEYQEPLYLTEDCTVRFYSMLRKGVTSEVGSYEFIFADHQAPAAVFTADEEGRMLTMSCTLPGAEIRYTADGTEPDENSLLYSEPVEITSYLYRAKVFADDYFPSGISEYSHTGAALISPVPTAEFINKKLYLSVSDVNATILYTCDEEADLSSETAWQIYTEPISLTANCLVRFFSRKEGYSDSDVQSFTFIYSNYRAAEPTIERNAEGTHIVMETTTENGEIRYTTDDTEPTVNSPLYTEPILIECNGTFSAKTFAEGLFESQTNRYVVSNMGVPDPYVFFGNKHFTLMCLDPLAEIWYTLTDASTDDMSQWTLYTEPIVMTGNCTLRFFSRRQNFNDSDIESLTYVHSDYQMQAPSIVRNNQGTHVIMTASSMTPPSGYIPDEGEGVISGPEIRYTTDGSVPTEESALYTAPVRITSGAVYRARVFDHNYYDSEITEYAIGNSSLPVPEAQVIDFALNLTCSDPDASIWYTTDPNATFDNLDLWILYTAPIVLTEDCTYRFFAGDDDDNASDIQAFVFQKSDYTVAAPTVERSDDGLYVVMECATPGADIRYTTDGTVPTESSMLYTGPVAIPCNITYIAKAFLNGFYDSEVTEFVVANIKVPVATATVVDRKLVLNCADSEAEIWYTTDPQAVPENIEDWILYEAPVSLSENAIFHFFTRRENFSDSDIETFVFLKANYQVETPLITRNQEGSFLEMTCATEGAEIHYTTDGTEPTEESTLYTEPVMIQGNGTYRAKAFAQGLFESGVAEYTVMNLAVMNPYALFENTELILMIGDPDAEIWYAIADSNSEENSEEWLLYQEPISGFTGDCEVRFFGRKVRYDDSPVQTFTLVYADYQAPAPEISVSESGNEVEIVCSAPEGVIRYTHDIDEVDDPDENSEVYTEPLALIEGQNIVKARVFIEGMFPSEISVLSYKYSDPTGVETIDAVGKPVFTIIDNVAGFISSEACDLNVYDTNGVSIAVLHLNAGFTPLPEYSAGVYIIGGYKIRM